MSNRFGSITFGGGGGGGDAVGVWGRDGVNCSSGSNYSIAVASSSVTTT